MTLGGLHPAIQSTPLVQKAYTPDGLLSSIADGKTHTTSFAYDGLDQLSTTTYPNSSTKVLGYDANSNILTRQTGAGAIITYVHDTLNRLSTKTPPSPAAVVTYGYDLAGHLTGVSDTSGDCSASDWYRCVDDVRL